MKSLLLIFVVFVLLMVHSSCFAQKNAIDSLRLADSQWSLEKRAMVLRYMQLTEAEKSSFWPVFEHYQSAMRYLEMEYVYLLTRFARGYQSLPEKEYGTLLRELQKIDMTQARIRQQFFKKFKKALSPTQADTFMRLDNTFRTKVRLEAQKDLPEVEAYALRVPVKK